MNLGDTIDSIEILLGLRPRTRITRKEAARLGEGALYKWDPDLDVGESVVVRYVDGVYKVSLTWLHNPTATIDAETGEVLDLSWDGGLR